MSLIQMNTRLPALVLAAAFAALGGLARAQAPSFRFAFMTDMHLSFADEANIRPLHMAVDSALARGVDFILTGGDNIDIDNQQDSAECVRRYERFSAFVRSQKVPVYPAIGNHDRYWASGSNSPLANTGLWHKYLGAHYYAFDHKGWHFIVLNTAEPGGAAPYRVGPEQMEWLRRDLAALAPETPIAVVAHVPFLSLYYPALEGRFTDTDMFANFKEIRDMFAGRNLRLVLQGHQHLYEEIKVLGVQFITGGAVSAGWWGGAFHGTEEGFLLVEAEGDDFRWEYVDYGWEAKP
jgi:3',5'-cyclic AMP phosphodiesterase CpdA